MVIDFHVHTFTDSLAPKALHNLNADGSKPMYTDATVSDTLTKMEKWGVDRFVILSVATKPTQPKHINDWILEQQSRNPNKIIGFGALHPDAPDTLEELSRLKSLGIPGIKLHPDFQDFMIDEERLFPLYDACAQLNMAILFHCGFDAVSPVLIHAPPHRTAKVAELFPKLTMICAHFGGYDQWEEVYSVLAGKNVYLDTAYCAHRMSSKMAEKIISKHGAEKILFASDCPWDNPADTIRFVDSLAISEHAKQLIFSDNARRLLKI